MPLTPIPTDPQDAAEAGRALHEKPIPDQATIDRALSGEIVVDIGHILPVTKRALNKLVEQGRLARCRGYWSSLAIGPLKTMWIAPIAQATVGRVVEIVEARAPFWAAREAFVAQQKAA